MRTGECRSPAVYIPSQADATITALKSCTVAGTIQEIGKTVVTQVIKKLLDRLSGKYERLDEQDIEKAIDILIEETDPRLRLIGGYRRKLRKPVIRSLAYLNGLVGRIPGPFEVNRKAYGSNPQVNALFGSADDIEALVNHNKVLKQYFRDKPDHDLVYVPMAMNRTEKTVLGMERSGDVIKREVAQRAVNFSDHFLGVCASSDGELRDMLIWRGIHNLAITALENITRMKLKTSELNEQRTLLKIKLRDLQAQQRGLDALTADPNETGSMDSITRHLEETERQLGEAQAHLGTLADYLVHVCKVFNHPSRHLRVKPNSVRVDRMGIKVEDASSDRGAEVVSAAISIGDNPPFEAIIASFRRPGTGQE